MSEMTKKQLHSIWEKAHNAFMSALANIQSLTDEVERLEGECKMLREVCREVGVVAVAGEDGARWTYEAKE